MMKERIKTNTGFIIGIFFNGLSYSALIWDLSTHSVLEARDDDYDQEFQDWTTTTGTLCVSSILISASTYNSPIFLETRKRLPRNAQFLFISS